MLWDGRMIGELLYASAWVGRGLTVLTQAEYVALGQE